MNYTIFLKQINIDYVNIFDLSCRNCITGNNLSEQKIEEIGNSEFEANVNKKAFGLKLKQHNKNKSKKKRNKRLMQKGKKKNSKKR